MTSIETRVKTSKLVSQLHQRLRELQRARPKVLAAHKRAVAAWRRALAVWLKTVAPGKQPEANRATNKP